MTKENRVQIFTKVADVELLSKTIGISTESVIEFVCGNEHTFNSWYNLYLKK